MFSALAFCNRVHDTGSPRRRLVFDRELGRDASVESTQLQMTIDACKAEVKHPIDDLGVDAAVYRNTAES